MATKHGRNSDKRDEIIKYFNFKKIEKEVKKEVKLDVVSDANEVEFNSRPQLKKYLGFGSLDFHAVYGYKSSLIDGSPVALLKDVRDPLNHDILTNHVWVKLNAASSNMLGNLKKDSPIRVRARVIKYNGDKIGLQVSYINLVRGQRDYTIGSTVMRDKDE